MEIFLKYLAMCLFMYLLWMVICWAYSVWIRYDMWQFQKLPQIQHGMRTEGKYRSVLGSYSYLVSYSSIHVYVLRLEDVNTGKIKDITLKEWHDKVQFFSNL